MKSKWKKGNRKIHYWGSAICALPILLVIITGIILLLRKDIAWIQPPTQKGQGTVPQITFVQILEKAQSIPSANIQEWSDITRLDIRPKKGVIKVRSHNNWEIQIDHQNTEILQVAYRRSGIIESLHDGTFFHRYVSLGIFLPSSILLLILWITGILLFISTFRSKKKKKDKKEKKRAKKKESS